MSVTLEQLQAEIAVLRAEAAAGRRAMDELEIQKVQSLYSHYYHVGLRAEVPKLFAQHTPGVSLEVEDSGVHVGIESITRFWHDVFGGNKPFSPGWMAVHMTCNPVIEINREGTKAKGVWHSHGFCTLPINGKTPFICSGKYDMEYVKEDGTWKIFTFIYRQIFMSPYHQGWVEAPSVGSIAANPLNKPDKPTTAHTPYTPDAPYYPLPAPPAPFE